MENSRRQISPKIWRPKYFFYVLLNLALEGFQIKKVPIQQHVRHCREREIKFRRFSSASDSSSANKFAAQIKEKNFKNLIKPHVPRNLKCT